MEKPEGKFRNSKVAVLMGGPGGEREVSLRSGKAVHQALLDRGYDAIAIDPDPSFLQRLHQEKVEVVYNALHGKWGEDGLVQAMLETAQIPYSSSGVLASAVTMDKVLTKKVLQDEGLPTPNFCTLHQGERLQEQQVSFALPWVVKPSREGSSLGISICRTAEEVPNALETAFRYDRVVLVEEFISGRELTVGVLGLGRKVFALPLVEIVPQREFYDYEAKYTKGGSNYFCPAEVPEEIVQDLQKIAVESYAVFRCRGGVRVDYRLNSNNEGLILEINTSPGMTELSLLPMAAKSSGLSFADLVEWILDSAGLEERFSW